MTKHECFQLVFSSSCTVYGNPKRLPITEDSPIGDVTNVYGRTKHTTELMLMDLSRADQVIQIYHNSIRNQHLKIIFRIYLSVGIFVPCGILTKSEPILQVGSERITRNRSPIWCLTFRKLQLEVNRRSQFMATIITHRTALVFATIFMSSIYLRAIWLL